MNAGTTGPVDQPSLNVDGRHLAELLNLVGELKGLGRKPAVFSFQDGRLIVDLPETRLSASASGSWPNPVNVSLKDLRRIAREMQCGDGNVAMSIVNGRLRIGGFSAAVTHVM